MTTQVTHEVRAGRPLPDFGHLFEQYRYRATRYAYRLMGQPADADELVAIAFAKILDIMRRGLGPDDDNFWPYLVVTLRHCAASLHRQRRLEKLTDDEALIEIATSVSRSDQLAEAASELAANHREMVMVRAFRRLPKHYRLVLLLTEVEQLPLAVVGFLMNLSANGAAALAYRARKRLRELYRLEEKGVH